MRSVRYSVGRRSFEVLRAGEGGGGFDMEKFVFSRTLDPAEHADVTVVAEGAGAFVRELKRRDGKDLWLFGGGIPLLPCPADHVPLRLESRRVYEKTGTVWLEYAIV